jgi:hypothetical protein
MDLELFGVTVEGRLVMLWVKMRMEVQLAQTHRDLDGDEVPPLARS